MNFTDKLKKGLKQPFIDFMDWFRTHPEYENVVSSRLVDLYFESLVDKKNEQDIKICCLCGNKFQPNSTFPNNVICDSCSKKLKGY